jgi:hypothetical protein
MIPDITDPDTWTIEEIERTRARIMADVSRLVPARVRSLHDQRETWGNPKRCETNETGFNGDCLFCCAVNGQSCLNPDPPLSASSKIGGGND